MIILLLSIMSRCVLRELHVIKSNSMILRSWEAWDQTLLKSSLLLNCLASEGAQMKQRKVRSKKAFRNQVFHYHFHFYPEESNSKPPPPSQPSENTNTGFSNSFSTQAIKLENKFDSFKGLSQNVLSNCPRLTII